jgi:hypothetical protein
VAGASPPPEKPVDSVTQQAIEGCVRGYLSAIGSGDLAAASRYLAPKSWGGEPTEVTAEPVGRLIRDDPALRKVRSVAFRRATVRYMGFAQVKLTVTLSDGRRSEHDFSMASLDQGRWGVVKHSAAPELFSTSSGFGGSVRSDGERRIRAGDSAE